MFGLSIPVLIAYAIFAFAAMAALAGANNAVKHHYVDPVVAEAEKKLAAEKLNTTNEKSRAERAEAANKSLEESIQKRLASCTEKTDLYQQTANAFAMQAEDEHKKAVAARKAMEAAVAKLQDQASGPPTSGDACAQADKILTDLAVDVRDILGIPKDTPPRKPETGPTRGAGRGRLRVGD